MPATQKLHFTSSHALPNLQKKTCLAAFAVGTAFGTRLERLPHKSYISHLPKPPNRRHFATGTQSATQLVRHTQAWLSPNATPRKTTLHTLTTHWVFWQAPFGTARRDWSTEPRAATPADRRPRKQDPAKHSGTTKPFLTSAQPEPKNILERCPWWRSYLNPATGRSEPIFTTVHNITKQALVSSF